MGMSKKDFIALADAIRKHHADGRSRFTIEHMTTLGAFCMQQNARFLPERWLAYAAGKCGPNGGKVK